MQVLPVFCHPRYPEPSNSHLKTYRVGGPDEVSIPRIVVLAAAAATDMVAHDTTRGAPTAARDDNRIDGRQDDAAASPRWANIIGSVFLWRGAFFFFFFFFWIWI